MNKYYISTDKYLNVSIALFHKNILVIYEIKKNTFKTYRIKNIKKWKPFKGYIEIPKELFDKVYIDVYTSGKKFRKSI